MKKTTLAAMLSLACIPLIGASAAGGMGERLSGRILLQVEEHGEAWYVNPTTHSRHFLSRPQNAFDIMRGQGVGITNSDLSKLPIGLTDLSGADTDGDGLTDAFEEAVGTDKDKADTDGDGFTDRQEIMAGYSALGAGRPATDPAFAQAQAGRIFLQVESHGEAWWVNPENGHRYFLGRPTDAFAVMRSFGLGISNSDLSEIDDAEGGTETAPTEENSAVAQCGTIDVLNENNGEALSCFNERMNDCSSASASVTQSFLGITTNWGLEITGGTGPETCAVKVHINQGGMEPNSEGLEMTCDYRRDMDILESLSEDVEQNCTGSYVDYTVSGGIRDEYIEPLSHGIFDGMKQNTTWVAASQGTFDSLWSLLYPNAAIAPEKPSVNFSTHSVVLVFGDRNEYSVKILAVNDGAVIQSNAQQDSSCPTAISQAFDLVSVPKDKVGDEINGRAKIGRKVNDCRPETPNAGDLTYSNEEFGFSMALPDPMEYFTVSTVPAEGGKFARIEFSQYSASMGENSTQFVIHVVPSESWPEIEESGTISWTSGSAGHTSYFKKMSSDDDYVFLLTVDHEATDLPEFSTHEFKAL